METKKIECNMIEYDWDRVKKALGEYAVSHFLPKEGIIGLGTGSTSACFIEALGKIKPQRLKAVATSNSSASLATKYQIPLITNLAWTEPLACTFDGADYIDIVSGYAIKGLGGALVREKIAARSSKRLILMIDERKVMPDEMAIEVTIPIEINQFGQERTKLLLLEAISKKYLSTIAPRYLSKEDKLFFITDNGNIILDLKLTIQSKALPEIEQLLRAIPGVVDTGIFIGLTTDILIGLKNGAIEHRSIRSIV